MDMDTIVSTSDDNVTLWDVETGMPKLKRAVAAKTECAPHLAAPSSRQPAPHVTDAQMQTWLAHALKNEAVGPPGPRQVRFRGPGTQPRRRRVGIRDGSLRGARGPCSRR